MQRLAIVTGGTTGIGLSVAKALMMSGHRVAIGARHALDPEVHAQITKDFGASVFVDQLDVAQGESVNKFVDKVRTEFGPPAILVNAAGIFNESFLHDHSDAAWLDQIEVNLTGAFRMTRAVFPDVIFAKWGRIANIASTAGTKGAAGYAGYCASKAGLIGLSKATAVEGAPNGISCISLSPTWVETPMMQNAIHRIASKKTITNAQARAILEKSNPQGRLVQPSEIAAMVDFFCSERSPGLTNVDIQINAGADW